MDEPYKIVERLAANCAELEKSGGRHLYMLNDMIEAASTIEALAAALKKIEGGWIDDKIDDDDFEASVVAMQEIARTALSLLGGNET